MICLCIEINGKPITGWYDLKDLDSQPYAVVPHPEDDGTLPEQRVYLDPQKIFDLPSRQERRGYRGRLSYSDIEAQDS